MEEAAEAFEYSAYQLACINEKSQHTHIPFKVRSTY
jgi:hypothetical protein